jgi:outer membrane protein assembly factor BamB
VAATAGAAFLFVWLRLEVSPQQKVVFTGMILVVATLLLLAWSLLLSGFAARTRMMIAAAVAAIAMLAPLLLEVRGVTGDLVPILGWRFAPPSDPAIDAVTQEAAPSESAAAVIARSRDYPQFLGPDRKATVTGVVLATDWDQNPPRLVWQREVGPAWSAFAVFGNDAITQEQRADAECVVCYALESGAVRWIHQDMARYDTTLGGTGPRATPTIAGDRVYTVGATGILNCLDRRSGQTHWTRDVVAENGAAVNHWGTSGSPLVHGDLVIVNAGGPRGRSIVAYDRFSGAPVYGGGDDGAGYSSPLAARLAGVEQIVAFNAASVTGHDAATGRVLWQFPWSGRNPNVAQPLILGEDRVFVSSGYGVGCALHRVQRGPRGEFLVEPLWRNRNLKAKFANAVVLGQSIYGLDEGILVCLDADTGERRWKSGRYGHGQMILVDDRLLITAEDGSLVLVAATPEEHRELARFELFEEKLWNSAAFAAPYLLVRTERTAACYELPSN